MLDDSGQKMIQLRLSDVIFVSQSGYELACDKKPSLKGNSLKNRAEFAEDFCPVIKVEPNLDDFDEVLDDCCLLGVKWVLDWDDKSLETCEKKLLGYGLF